MAAKRLIVMRHAKSSWSSGASSDHERPLNKRGQRDAPLVAEELERLGWIPDLVVSSTSKRTRETWELMEPTFPAAVVEFTTELYHAGHRAVRAELRDREADTILVLGHNPGWEELVSRLAGHYVEMTTANAALLESEADNWREAFDGTWELEAVLRPKALL